MHAFKIILPFVSFLLFLSACVKDHPPMGNSVSSHSAEVVDKWITLQLRLIRNSTGIPNHSFGRQYAYSGIAALEAVAPGLPPGMRKHRAWNGLTGLPVAFHNIKMYYPASVNVALATMNRYLFPNASAADKSAIDSLEAALNQSFESKAQPAIIQKSREFGKAVAEAVYQWSEGDGYKNANAPYTPPTGPGLWAPTPPNNLAALTPFWGNNRTVVAGSISGAELPAPTPYSSEMSSPFYNIAKQVHGVSTVLTDDQKAMATFWRDVPGVSSPGHWLSILQQVMQQKKSKLDKAVIAYALTGAAINDAVIICWKMKYKYNLLRPITYIREMMGYGNWSSLLGTPNHPEYPSGHSSLSGAAAKAFELLFGNSGSFTDHTYDYMGLSPRTYSSYNAIGYEAGISRLYGGIHYQIAIDAGLWQGKKVTLNIFGEDDQVSLK